MRESCFMDEPNVVLARYRLEEAQRCLKTAFNNVEIEGL